MRPRIRNVAIVASTNPKTNSKICEIRGLKSRLDKPVMVGIRTGIHKRAVLRTSHINMQERWGIDTGSFKCATHKSRIAEKVIHRMCQKIS
jgi:hypothetical protein